MKPVAVLASLNLLKNNVLPESALIKGVKAKHCEKIQNYMFLFEYFMA